MREASATGDDRGTTRRLGGTRWRRVVWFDRIDSTNRFLLDAAARGEPPDLVAVADVQTAGRGRRGRRWEAPPGSSLLASALVRPAVPVDDLHLVTVVAALGALDALEAVAGIDARLKWPNDVLVDDRKLAGILAESRTGRGGTDVVVGIGVNATWERFPDDLAASATACNLVTGRSVDRADLLVAWLRAFHHALVRVERGDREAVRARYLARCTTLGRRVRVELARREVVGAAETITPAGHLVVRGDDGERVEVAAGDVVHLRPA